MNKWIFILSVFLLEACGQQPIPNENQRTQPEDCHFPIDGVLLPDFSLKESLQKEIDINPLLKANYSKKDIREIKEFVDKDLFKWCEVYTSTIRREGYKKIGHMIHLPERREILMVELCNFEMCEKVDSLSRPTGVYPPWKNFFQTKAEIQLIVLSTNQLILKVPYSGMLYSEHMEDMEHFVK